MELIPIIINQDRLLCLVAKFQSGNDHTGGVPFGDQRYAVLPGVKDWLDQSNPAGLALLCESLANCRYAEAAAILGFAWRADARNGPKAAAAVSAARRRLSTNSSRLHLPPASVSIDV